MLAHILLLVYSIFIEVVLVASEAQSSNRVHGNIPSQQNLLLGAFGHTVLTVHSYVCAV